MSWDSLICSLVSIPAANAVLSLSVPLMALLATPLALDPLIYHYIIATTNASFQAVLSLLTPIVFVIISTMLTKDKVTRNKIVGFLFAVLGCTVMVAIPNLGNTSAMNFGSLPVALMFIQAICISFEIIIWRKENERGTPLVVILGVFCAAWSLIAGIIAISLGEVNQVQNLSITNFLIVIYLGLIISILYNVVFTNFYRYFGTTSTATMKYFKKALAIIMPIIVLGEVMSWQTTLGTLLIVIGTIVVHNKPKSRSSKNHR